MYNFISFFGMEVFMENDCFTPEEEAVIFRKINECPETFKRLFKGKPDPQDLSSEEQAAACPSCSKSLSLCYQEKVSLLQEIVTKNLGLIGEIIKKKEFSSAVDHSDIFNAGVIGLIEAIRGFKIKLGYKFSTYAFRGINFRINIALRSSGHQSTTSIERRRLVKLPRYAKYIIHQDGSLDISDSSISTEEDLSQKEAQVVTRNTIRKMLAEIPNARDREIIRSRFGIGGPKLTLQAIGDQLGLSRQGVQQVEVRVLCWLREQEPIQQLAG